MQSIFVLLNIGAKNIRAEYKYLLYNLFHKKAFLHLMFIVLIAHTPFCNS